MAAPALTKQADVDALLGSARTSADASVRANCLLRAIDAITKRNRALIAPNLEAFAAFKVLAYVANRCLPSLLP
jgi:hypothetical protein